MKIAFSLGSLNRGGTETLLLDIFKNAQNADFQFIGIHRKGGVLQEDFYATKQKIIQLAPKFPFDVFYLLHLRKFLKRENIQVVHCQQYIDTFYAKIATQGTKIKVVQTFHGFEKNCFLLRFIIKKTDRIFFVSNYQRAFYTKKYNLKPEQQATVYNGISFEKFSASLPPFSKTEEFYNLPNIEKKSLKLATVGNFVMVRDPFTICKFLKLLDNQYIEFDFYFIGKKNEAEAWRYDNCVKFCEENNLTDKVHFLGSRSDVPAILHHIDAFLYSTNHDTFGIAVIEAIAMGVPTFVNDWDVMQEITQNGKFATLYKTKDENDLLEKFLDFVKNREKYQQKAKTSTIEVKNMYSIENHIVTLTKNYEQILLKI